MFYLVNRDELGCVGHHTIRSWLVVCSSNPVVTVLIGRRHTYIYHNSRSSPGRRLTFTCISGVSCPLEGC